MSRIAPNDIIPESLQFILEEVPAAKRRVADSLERISAADPPTGVPLHRFLDRFGGAYTAHLSDPPGGRIRSLSKPGKIGILLQLTSGHILNFDAAALLARAPPRPGSSNAHQSATAGDAPIS